MRRRDFVGALDGANNMAARGARAASGYSAARLYERLLIRSEGYCCPLFAKGSTRRLHDRENIAIEHRFSEGHDNRPPAIAAEFVRRE
jgi:hypothetical protein